MKLDFDDHLLLELNERGYLRPLQESDVTALYIDGLNDPEVNRYLIGPRSQRQTEATVREFIRINRAAENSILFGLFVDEVLSGTLRLHDATAKEVYMGLALFNKRVWGQRWGRAMIDAATRFALTELGLDRVKAGIAADNIASQKAFLDCGYRHDNSSDKWFGDLQVQAWDIGSPADPRGTD